MNNNNTHTMKNLNVKLEDIDTSILKLHKNQNDYSNTEFSYELENLKNQAEAVKKEILDIQFAELLK
tara:strand:+ start:461 stop:661 length:201 start_codon:yes stop_codon:yes gene_type:complete